MTTEQGTGNGLNLKIAEAYIGKRSVWRIVWEDFFDIPISHFSNSKEWIGKLRDRLSSQPLHDYVSIPLLEFMRTYCDRQLAHRNNFLDGIARSEFDEDLKLIDLDACSNKEEESNASDIF